MRNLPVHDYFLKCLNTGYHYVIKIENYDKILDGVIYEKQMDEITSLLFGNICSNIDYFTSIQACEEFDTGLTQQGLVPLIVRYLQNIRECFKEYKISRDYKELENDFYNSDILFRCRKLICYL